MLFRSTYPRVPGSGTLSQSTGIAPDIAADRHLDRGFLAGPAWVRAVAVEPGREQFRWPLVVLDERGPCVPPEYRGPVAAAAGVAAGQVPAVLPEPVPQGGLAGGGQCVRADPHDAAAAVAADLAVFEEEVDAAAGAVAGPAVPQLPRAAKQPGEFSQHPVELARSCHDPGRTRGGRDCASGRCWRRRGRRAACLPLAARCPGQAGLVARGGDGEGVSGGADGEPEGVPGPLRADPAGGDGPAQGGGVGHRAARHLPGADLGQPVPGLPAAEVTQARGSDRSGNPSAARASASRIWARWPAQYRSYFDVTPPVCPDDHGTRQSSRAAGCVIGWPDVPGGHRYPCLPKPDAYGRRSAEFASPAGLIDCDRRPLAVAEFPATSGGHRRLLGWLSGFGPVARVARRGHRALRPPCWSPPGTTPAGCGRGHLGARVRHRTYPRGAPAGQPTRKRVPTIGPDGPSSRADADRVIDCEVLKVAGQRTGPRGRQRSQLLAAHFLRERRLRVVPLGCRRAACSAASRAPAASCSPSPGGDSASPAGTRPRPAGIPRRAPQRLAPAAPRPPAPARPARPGRPVPARPPARPPPPARRQPSPPPPRPAAYRPLSPRRAPARPQPRPARRGPEARPGPLRPPRSALRARPAARPGPARRPAACATCRAASWRARSSSARADSAASRARAASRPALPAWDSASPARDSASAARDSAPRTATSRSCRAAATCSCAARSAWAARTCAASRAATASCSAAAFAATAPASRASASCAAARASLASASAR